LTHNIAIKRYCDKKDIFEPWISKGQGKHLTKKLIKVNKQTKQFNVCFLELTLVGHDAQNFLFI